jgi:glycerol-3-phosphate dehydrogenase
LAKAELWFCIQHEMVQTPLDFFIRRTGKLFFDIESIGKLKEPILKEFKTVFNWDKKTLEQNKNELEKAVVDTITFI